MNNKHHKNQLIILMGVSGSGKSTLAKSLAQHLHWQYMEADDYHSLEAKQRMAAGIALTDDIREPWIQSMLKQLTQNSTNNVNTVLSYSGLKKKHRDRFRKLPVNLQFFHLTGEKDLIQKRMDNRENHFMPSHLLDSQFNAMESTERETDVIQIAMEQSTPHQLAEVLNSMTDNNRNL